MRGFVLFGVLTLVVHATVARAQDAPPAPPPGESTEARKVADLPVMPGSSEQVDELTAWMKKATEWQKWDERYRGVAQWNWAGQPAERKAEPTAPPWLAQACSDFSDGRVAATQQLLDACALNKSLSKDHYDIIAEQIDRDRQWYRTQHENVDKSWFFSKLHFDVPYVMAQTNGWHTYTYFGVHITPFDIKKRVYVWLPPGVSLISVPAPDGHKLMPAYGAGLSFRWFDFRFPQASAQSTLYFNLAEFFVQDSTIPGMQNKFTMMGFSITAKKPK
jgi:hypothetical protein